MHNEIFFFVMVYFQHAASLDFSNRFGSLVYTKPLMDSEGPATCKDIVHNCTIFLCSLDVRNIVQGGDPLYAGVNHKEGCGGHNLPKWVRF